MKRIIMSVAVIMLPWCVQAQVNEASKHNDYRSPSLVAGVLADVHMANTYAFTSENSLDLLSGGGVVFVRKYLGEHFALQVDLSATISERTFIYPYYFMPGPEHSMSYQLYSLDIPLSFQYHMGKTDNRLRPYVGVGIGYASANSYAYYNNWPEIDQNPRSVNTGVMMQATEGITYRINKKLLFEQSMYYKIVQDIGNHRMGLRFGIGYSIM